MTPSTAPSQPIGIARASREAAGLLKTKQSNADVTLRDLQGGTSIRWTGDVPRSQKRVLRDMCGHDRLGRVACRSCLMSDIEVRSTP
jgi:hypothetical protein